MDADPNDIQSQSGFKSGVPIVALGLALAAFTVICLLICACSIRRRRQRRRRFHGPRTSLPEFQIHGGGPAAQGVGRGHQDSDRDSIGCDIGTLAGSPLLMLRPHHNDNTSEQLPPYSPAPKSHPWTGGVPLGTVHENSPVEDHVRQSPHRPVQVSLSAPSGSDASHSAQRLLSGMSPPPTPPPPAYHFEGSWQ